MKLYDGRARKDAAKGLAILNGDKTYRGKPCKRCESTERYTKSAQCVVCSNNGKLPQIVYKRYARSDENERRALAALERGETIFEPEGTCPNGHKMRYVSSNNCYNCDVERRSSQKLKRRYQRIANVYGLSEIQYHNLVNKQESKCFICSKHFSNSFALHIDHCHTTRKVRGLLCNKCNQAIGLLNESPVLIKKVLDYINFHNWGQSAT